MIREQNFSASSGGPFSCWLKSFSSRVRPADETVIRKERRQVTWLRTLPGEGGLENTAQGHHRCQDY